jgi:catechol 2,3-dioxygenase-like lactoylglutathione lyase family enzyme
MSPDRTGALHHVELRVADLDGARASWGWLLERLGYRTYQQWSAGTSWRLGETYLVVERANTDAAHDRRIAGLSHLAFHAGSPDDVDRIAADAEANGWSPLYAERYPWAGGAPSADFAGHYAAYLENAERFKVELVAEPLISAK